MPDEQLRTDVDLELLAMLWARAKPFEDGELTSNHPRTRRAIAAFLEGSRTIYAFRSVLSSGEVSLLTKIIARGPPYRPRSLPAAPPPPPRVVLAPLAPDAFLAWANPEAPATVRGIWFEMRDPLIAEEDVRRSVLQLAARVRRDQRLGLDPWGSP